MDPLCCLIIVFMAALQVRVEPRRLVWSRDSIFSEFFLTKSLSLLIPAAFTKKLTGPKFLPLFLQMCFECHVLNDHLKAQCQINSTQVSSCSLWPSEIPGNKGQSAVALCHQAVHRSVGALDPVHLGQKTSGPRARWRGYKGPPFPTTSQVFFLMCFTWY